MIRTNIITAHITCLGTDSIVDHRGSVRQLAVSNLILASVGHGVGEFHVVVHGFVDLSG